MITYQNNVVSIWVGERISQKTYEEYVANDYSEEEEEYLAEDYYDEDYYDEDPDRPNKFVEDLGETIYYHPDLEATRHETPQSLAGLVGQLSYAESFMNEAAEAAAQLQLGQEFNTIVALYEQRFQGKWPNDSPLIFLGTFAFQDPKCPSPSLRPGDHSGSIVVGRTIAPNLVATAGRFGEVRFWDTTNARSIPTDSEHSIDDWVHSICVSTDGTAMYTSSDEVLRWDLTSTPIESRKIASWHHGFPIGDIALLPDQRTIAGACVDKTVGLLDLQNGEEALLSHAEPVNRVLPLPDRKHLVSVSQEVKIELTPSETVALFTIWDLQSRKKLREVKLPLAITPLVLLRDQNTVLFGTELGNLVWWDWRETKPQRIVHAHVDGWVQSVELSGDAERVITAGDKSAKVWLVNTGDLIASFDQHADEVKAACFLDKDHAVSGSRDATIRVWRISDGKQLACFTDAPDDREEIDSYLDDPWEIVCMAADNATIVAGETSGRVRILRFDGERLNLLR